MIQFLHRTTTGFILLQYSREWKAVFSHSLEWLSFFRLARILKISRSDNTFHRISKFLD